MRKACPRKSIIYAALVALRYCSADNALFVSRERTKSQQSNTSSAEVWPALPYDAWRDTCATLHVWTLIVGKVRVAQTPWIKHFWHVTSYVTTPGLTTLSILQPRV
jgi:hypothetical protein